MRPRASVISAVTASVVVAVGAVGFGMLTSGPTSTPGVAAVERSIVLPDPVRAGPVPAALVPPLTGAYYDLPAGYADDCHLDFPELDPPGCVYGPRCGDGVVQSDSEECDDGANEGGYGECAPGCVYGPHCGDEIVQSAYEECDDGTEGSERCTPACQLRVFVE